MTLIKININLFSNFIHIILFRAIFKEKKKTFLSHSVSHLEFQHFFCGILLANISFSSKVIVSYLCAVLPQFKFIFSIQFIAFLLPC